MKLFKISLAALCIGAILYTIGCRPKAEDTVNDETNSTELVKVPLLTLSSRDTTLDREYVASIRAMRNVEIRSHLRGFLEQTYVDEGRFVSQGQLLFRINDEELRAQLREAQANIAIMEAESQTVELEVSRLKQLVEKRVMTESELSLAKAKLAAAESRIKQARAVAENLEIRIGYTRIKAPFNGYVDKIPMKVGSLVSESDLLTTFSDISQMHAYFEMSENEYLAISKLSNVEKSIENTPLKLSLADGSKYPLEGKVETMSSEFGQNTGSIAIRARFPNPNGLLKHGASGKILLTKSYKDVILIPQKAVFEIQDKNYVYVVGTDNIARIRSFAPLARAGNYYIVKEGLSVGERVASEGIQKIKDGMSIAAR